MSTWNNDLHSHSYIADLLISDLEFNGNTLEATTANASPTATVKQLFRNNFETVPAHANYRDTVIFEGSFALKISRLERFVQGVTGEICNSSAQARCLTYQIQLQDSGVFADH